MDNLWAPWRMEYILGEDKQQGCILCLDKNGPDPQRLVLRADDVFLVMMNKYPYINGHLLVAPKRHVAGLEDLTSEEMADLLKMVRDTIAS